MRGRRDARNRGAPLTRVRAANNSARRSPPRHGPYAVARFEKRILGWMQARSARTAVWLVGVVSGAIRLIAGARCYAQIGRRVAHKPPIDLRHPAFVRRMAGRVGRPARSHLPAIRTVRVGFWVIGLVAARAPIEVGGRGAGTRGRPYWSGGCQTPRRQLH